jgi:hypothetical protein
MPTIQCRPIVAPDDTRTNAPRTGSRSRQTRGIAVALGLVIVVAAVAFAATRGSNRPSHPSASGPGTSASVPGTAAPTPSSATPGGSLEPGDAIVGFASLEELRERGRQAAAGVQPAAAAVQQLLAWADGERDYQPRPSERLRINGTTGPFVDDTAAAYGLALAWGVRGDPADARASLRIVMAWVATTTRLANACPDGGECQTALIVSRNAPGFVFAMELIDASGVATKAQSDAFDAWLRDLILPAASTRSNNWGDAGAFLRAAATARLGDEAGWTKALDFWRDQTNRIDPDGEIPEEVRRGSSGLSYTQEALLYKVAVARLAERRGLVQWTNRAPNGWTPEAAVDFAARSMEDPAGWPTGRVDRPDPAPIWELVEQHSPSPLVASLVREGRPYGEDGHSTVRWTTVTNGVPLSP